MKRILMGTIAGALVIFMWGALVHLVLPLGNAGMSPLPHETVSTKALNLAINEPGLYVFPWMDMTGEYSDQEYKEWQEAYREGPVGMLFYKPRGGDPMAAHYFINEILTDLAASLLACLLLSLTTLAYLGRMLFVGGLGLFSWVTSSIPYWNWYGFPADFTLAAGAGMVLGWLLAGVVIAAIVKPEEQ